MLAVGDYTARKAKSEADLTRCQALRHLAFFGLLGSDADRFDSDFEHLMIESEGRLLATARLRVLAAAHDLDDSYTGQFYRVEGAKGPMIELGRLCLAQEAVATDALRLLWAAITLDVDRIGAQWLVGCSSLAGVTAQAHVKSFKQLAQQFIVDDSITITAKAPEKIDIRDAVRESGCAQKPFPPLLRSYLTLGGKVGPVATVDHQMGTIHLCTLLQISSIPEPRAAALRAIAAQTGLQTPPARNS